jgi:ribosomal 50S subunit-associated protein YjgA (DUF615 family)
VPYGPFIGNNFIFMDDNAHPHIAQIVQHIMRLQWLARSPDLNPIEHFWNRLGLQLEQRRVAFRTLNELQDALLEEWENLPQEYIQSLFDSIPRRMAAAIRARGGNTRY